MLRRISIGLTLAIALRLGAQPLPPVLTDTIATPAVSRATSASLFTAPDGTVWLSWVEPADATLALRFSTFDAAAKKWREPRTIFSGASLTTNSMDFPQLAITAKGDAFAIWTDGHGGARICESHNHGTTWSAPVEFTKESDEVEKFSLTTLVDGRVLVAWLDGRGKRSGNKAQQLRARVLGEDQPDVLIDPSVCDCCQTSLTSFLDGGALVAYRGRTADEIRDIRTARFDGHAWSKPHALGLDGWHINACPMNGPRVAADGGRVSAAWFTAADNEPRVLASYSAEAGERFLMPLQIDRGHPAGRVDTVILRDGALLVTWLESDGSVWLRRVSPEFSANDPVAITPAGTVPVKNFPRVALVKNYAGGDSTAQIVVAFSSSDKNGALETVLATVREGELLTAEKNCDCAPSPEQLTGFPVRGTIAAIGAERGTLRVQHGEVPGVLAGGTHEFLVAPEALTAAAVGRQFLGRIEQHGGAWRLYDVRFLAMAK